MGEEGNGELLIKRYKVSIEKGKDVLEICCITLYLSLTMLKNVLSVDLLLSVLATIKLNLKISYFLYNLEN